MKYAHQHLSQVPVRINNWRVETKIESAYHAPEQGISVLGGDLVNHPVCGNMNGITTSRILGKKDGFIVTKNTIYELGDVDPQYEELYPQSKERLFSSLEEI